MEAIGGYFELADLVEGSKYPHNDGVLLNTGRNALEYILRSIGNVKHIYLPYYTCEVVLEPLKKLNIPYTYYHINTSFEIADELNPQDGEYIIANNYYGIKDAYIEKLAAQYDDQLIVDCAQAFFAKPIPGIKAFYSMRKYVGVADGGVAYLGNLLDDLVEVEEMENTDDHDSHLFKRKQFGAEAGFADYQANEKKLDDQPIRLMSFQTKWILDHIDYDNVVARRRENYQYLHEALGGMNVLSLPDMDTFACPMVYPFMMKTDRCLRNEFISKKVFVARYWPNVEEEEGFETETDLAMDVIPTPCDQRYGKHEMNKIMDIIKKMGKTVLFRDFEERDIDFIFRCKNDEELNKMVVGQFHPFTYEEAVNWVQGCMGEHETYKFWAIATNDEEQRIIGWAALSNIDKVNLSAETHSIVIADPDYNDGIAWIETEFYLLKYAFEELKLNRLYGVSLMGHKMSNQIGELLFFQTEGVLRQAFYKNNRFYDLQYIGILKDEYFAHKEAGDYELMSVIRRLRKLRKKANE